MSRSFGVKQRNCSTLPWNSHRWIGGPSSTVPAAKIPSCGGMLTCLSRRKKTPAVFLIRLERRI